jgi:hypothetical protein
MLNLSWDDMHFFSAIGPASLNVVRTMGTGHIEVQETNDTIASGKAILLSSCASGGRQLGVGEWPSFGEGLVYSTI